MVEKVLVIVLLISYSTSFCQAKRRSACTAVLICGNQQENISIIVQGLPGFQGPAGILGQRGSVGPRGLPGPRGRAGFVESPPSFYAQLPRLFTTKNHHSIIRPWLLSDSFNPSNVETYFSPNTGIFTAPKSGFYQFSLTIAVSQSRAVVHLTKNNEKICTIWLESIVSQWNTSYAWGWTSNSIDCFVYCQIGDEIYAKAVYRSEENFNSHIYGYSYSIFSGYMINER